MSRDKVLNELANSYQKINELVCSMPNLNFFDFSRMNRFCIQSVRRLEEQIGGKVTRMMHNRNVYCLSRHMLGD